MTEPSDYERVGGETGLREIIADFVARLFDDVMIGFMFTGRSRERLAEMEFQLAAQQLGGPWSYSGRAIGAVHAPLPIMGGHFARRRKILENTLTAHGVDPDITGRWLAHVDSLRDVVLGHGVDAAHCDHDTQALRGGAPSAQPRDANLDLETRSS